MQEIEKRLLELEKKVKKLNLTVTVLSTLFVMAVGFGKISFENASYAQKIRRDTPDVATSSIPNQFGYGQQSNPRVIEAEAFVLKDKNGKLRGMWSAESNNTTFAFAYKEKDPSIVMSVGDNYASLALNDERNNKVSLGVNNKFRSISITDDKEGNRFYVGATDENTVSELLAKKEVKVSVSGKESIKIESLGEKVNLVLGELRGSLINLGLDGYKMALSFFDNMKIENLRIETKNGTSEIVINSPLFEKKKTIGLADE